MSIVKKRLHVSGLTPAITAEDINGRLHGFGKVLDLDGFGVLNAVGEPRKFAYVTLEATESNVVRCLNVLSGTTWKGTKLRIGEAKLDYAQRLENQRKRAAEGVDEPPPKRKRLPRGVQGVHAKDMSVVNLENLDSHPGWHKTALSHLIRPMKMRPSHPLPERSGRHRTDSIIKKRKKRKPSSFDVPTRARVRTIDPRLYGAIHLREDMLEAVVESQPLQSKKTHSILPSSSAPDAPSVPKGDVHQSPNSPSVVLGEENMALPDFEKETARDLGLLTRMFGDNESQWGGKELIEDTISNVSDQMSDIVVTTESKFTTTAIESKPATQSPAKEKFKSLKDMFKPHEEDARFSLLAGLSDLDLDPAFDLDAPAPSSVTAPVAPAPVASTTPLPITSQPGGFTLDPNLPLFFPHPDNPRAKDLFTFARIEGWKFGRTGDSDAIRKRWEETKGSLTRDWKKRSREAVKAKKRRYGAREGEDV